jgi:hypothetical protein
MFLTSENERIDQTGILNQDVRNFWKDDNRGAYNSATLGGKGRNRAHPKSKHRESKERMRGAGGRTDVRFPSHVFSPTHAFFLGGYVDDANPSASERQAARGV